MNVCITSLQQLSVTLKQLCVLMQGDRCAIEVFVKLYNINEYNISRLINNPDSLAPREAYYPLASADFVFFFL